MALVELGGGRGWLEEAPGFSIIRIDWQIGHFLQITEAGRSYEQQQEHWDNYQRNGYPIALAPWIPSIHQLGGAIDTNEGQRILDVMHDNGWRRTVYRNGVLVEAWHFEYFYELDNHRHEAVGMVLGTDGVWRLGNQEDDMNELQAAQLQALYDGFFYGGPSLNDGGRAAQQSLADLAGGVRPFVRRGDAPPNPWIQELADVKTLLLELTGRPAPDGTGDVDEAALAAALAPLLAANLGALESLSDDELERIGEKTADVLTRRLAG